MTERQYKFVDGFLKMGAAPEAIAKSFKISIAKVQAVKESASYESYESTREFMDGLFGGHAFGL